MRAGRKSSLILAIFAVAVSFVGTNAIAGGRSSSHETVLQGGLPVGPTGTAGADFTNYINNRATLFLIATDHKRCVSETHQVRLHALSPATGDVLATQDVVVPGCASKRFDLFDLFGPAADGAVIMSESTAPHAMYACVRPEFKWPTPATTCKFGVSKRNGAPKFSMKPGKNHVFFGVQTARDVWNGPDPFKNTSVAFAIELVNPGSMSLNGSVAFYPASGPPIAPVPFALPPGGSATILAPSDFSGFDGDIVVTSDHDVIATGYRKEERQPFFCFFCDKPDVTQFLPLHMSHSALFFNH
jgi:hypothetical protein